jgi:hypothetical protein
MTFLENLHDAALLAVEVKWPDGVLTFPVRTASGMLVISGKALTSLTCSRRQPWGPSCSINRAWVEEQSSERHLFIEMQSGDLIHAVVGSVELLPLSK